MDICLLPSAVYTDLYKLTMGQAVLSHYDNVYATAVFINRGKTKFPPGFAKALQRQVTLMRDLEIPRRVMGHLRKHAYFLKEGYLEWLNAYRFKASEVSITQEDGDLKVTIHGPWRRIIYWEVPLMALISTLYYQMTEQTPTDPYWIERIYKKGEALQNAGVHFADFGTRRTYSPTVHSKVVKALKDSGDKYFVGTSNVNLAADYNLKPIGTFAHEWVMAHAAIYGNRMATEKALEIWAKEFGAYLGIALTDTFTTQAFLESFNAYYAKLFDGVRHDSGDPFSFVDKIVRHYETLRINPLHKTIVFSDSLNVEKAIKIAEYCNGKINCSFGIGTNFTNDVGVQPLNIVIKLAAITLPNQRVIPVVKLSDDPSKATGDKQAIKAAMYDFNIES